MIGEAQLSPLMAGPGVMRQLLCAANHPNMARLAPKERWMLGEALEAYWMNSAVPGPLTVAASVHVAHFQCSYDSRL